MSAPNLNSITDNLLTAAQKGFSSTLNGSIGDSSTEIPVNSLAGYTNGQSALLWIAPGTDSEELVYGIVDDNSLVNAVRGVLGDASAHSSGAQVVEYISSAHHGLVRKHLLVEHNQDGTHKSGIITSRDTKNTPTTADSAIISDAADSGALKKATLDKLVPDGSVTFPKLLADIFGGEVTTYTNPGTAGGTNSFFYTNLGGIKLFWGKTNSITHGGSGASRTITLPDFFTTIQAVTVNVSDMTVDARQNISASPSTTTNINLTIWSNGGTNPTGRANVFIVGT